MTFGSSSIVGCLVVGFFGLPYARLNAGWICIKNETKSTLFVQDAPNTPNGKAGRLVRLLPGETYREFETEPGEKKVNIYDAKHSKEAVKPLCEGKMSWNKDDVKMRIYFEKDEVKFGPCLSKKEEEKKDSTPATNTFPIPPPAKTPATSK